MTKPIDEPLELSEDWPEIGEQAPEKRAAAPTAPEKPTAPLPPKPAIIAPPRPIAAPPKAAPVAASPKPAPPKPAPPAAPPKPPPPRAPPKPPAIAATPKPAAPAVAEKPAPRVVAAKPAAVVLPQKTAPREPITVVAPQRPDVAPKAPPVAAEPPKPNAHAAGPDLPTTLDPSAPSDPWFDRALPPRVPGEGRDRRPAPVASQGLASSLCVFWLGDRAFGLETSLVGEVVAASSVTPVPLTPPSIVGIFNLRGTPVALVDLATVLDLSVPPPPERADQSTLAIVLREESILAAACVHRMDLVLPAGRGVFSQSRDADEHPVVMGFLEVEGRESGPITVLDKQALVERLERIKLR